MTRSVRGPASLRSRLRSSALVLGPCALLLGSVSPNAVAQVITPRTVPVHMNQQFDILPSDRSGMGGVTIAIDDPLLDPFVNPAKATRLRAGRVSVAPFFHSVSERRGGGRTLPISGAGSFGRWAAGGLFAIQQLDRPSNWNAPISERTASNQYVTAILARDLGHGLSVGSSAYWADLGAEEGIDQLYSGSDRIQQVGSASDLRLGLTKRWRGDRAFEAILLKSRFDMTHDVHYGAQRVFSPPNIVTDVPERSEQNRDHTVTWGAHSEYSQPVGTDGWRMGWLGTVNRLAHPKIPDYRLNGVRTVPRDPGHTWAYNGGVGMAKTDGNSTFGFDVVLEPMFSTTWAEAARDTVTSTGRVIPAGAHTVDNKFRFSNAILRFGFGHDMPNAADSTHGMGLQFGLSVYSIKYRLWQDDLVRATSRVQDEHWMEWTPTFGFHWNGAGAEFRYTFSMTCGAGGECVNLGCPFACGDDVTVSAPPPSPGGVIAAPTSALRFDGGRVVTHRLAVTLRIR